MPLNSLTSQPVPSIVPAKTLRKAIGVSVARSSRRVDTGVRAPVIEKVTLLPEVRAPGPVRKGTTILWVSSAWISAAPIET
ncbi:hypothetical protein ES708_32860 [subsurface metagenome]